MTRLKRGKRESFSSCCGVRGENAQCQKSLYATQKGEKVVEGGPTAAEEKKRVGALSVGGGKGMHYLGT